MPEIHGAWFCSISHDSPTAHNLSSLAVPVRLSVPGGSIPRTLQSRCPPFQMLIPICIHHSHFSSAFFTFWGPRGLTLWLAWPPPFLFLFAWDLCETWLRLLSMGWWGPSSGKCIRFPLVSGCFGRDVPWDKSQKPALYTTIRFDKRTKTILSLYCNLPMTFILLIIIWFTLCFHAFIYPSIDPSLVSYQVS